MSDAEAPNTGDNHNSDPITGENGSDQDAIKNIKSEFNRKIENISKMMEDNNKQFTSVIEQLMAQNKPAPQPDNSEDDLEDLMYSNPAEFKRRIAEQVKGEISQTLTQQQEAERAQAQAVNQVLSTMQQRFPEYGDQNSELSQTAIKIYDSLPDNVKADPASAYRIAMSDAAIELGVLPVDKRRKVQGDEDFSLDGGGDRRMSSKRRKSGEKGSIAEGTKIFSQLLGQDPDDPKTKERLEKAANRRSWGKYRRPGEDR